MGLDTVELVLEIEEVFGISITDEQAQGMITVGDIYEFLLEHCEIGNVTSREACLTSAAFYRLRQGLCRVQGLNRNEVRPSSRIDALMPRKIRREAWRCLDKTLSLHLPELRRPAWLSRFLLVGPLVLVALATLWVAIARPGQLRDAWPGLAIWGAYLAVEGLLVTRRFAVRLPDGIDTAGDVARRVLEKNYRIFHGQLVGWHHRDLWETLVRIIADCLGVDPARITPEAGMVADLGAG